MPAFRRKSTSHPKRPVPFLPLPSSPSPSLSLFFFSFAHKHFHRSRFTDSALLFFYIPFLFLYLYSFLFFFFFLRFARVSFGRSLASVPSNLTARLLVVLFLEIDHATFYTLMESLRARALFFKVEVDESTRLLWWLEKDFGGCLSKAKFIKFQGNFLSFFCIFFFMKNIKSIFHFDKIKKKKLVR